MKQVSTRIFLAVTALVATVGTVMAQNKAVPTDAESAFPYAETALVSAPPVQKGQALWDILYTYDLLAISGSNGNAAVCVVNNEFWVSRWAQDTLLLLDNAGNLIAKFNPGYGSGTSHTRAFAWDGTNIYASVNTTSIKKIDPGTMGIVGTINAPQTVRSLTYDPTANSGAGGFWISNFSTDIQQISMTGSLLATISAATHGLGAMYGTAFDNWTTGGPFLWVFDQGTGTSSDIIQINTSTGLQTGVIHDANGDVGIQSGSTGIAGGIFIDASGSTLTMVGVIQGTPSNILFGYDLDIPLALSEIPDPKGFLNINPSYATDMINVNIAKNNNDPVQLQIVDVSGRIVFDKTTHGINNYINVSKYENGLYFVRLVYDNQTYSSRFMKM